MVSSTILPERLDRMGNVIASSVQELLAILRDAVRQPGPWSAVGIVLIVVVAIGALRSKISASWIWLPVLATVTYVAIHRWLQLR